jgi:hypothetical protein
MPPFLLYHDSRLDDKFYRFARKIHFFNLIAVQIDIYIQTDDHIK